MLETFFCFLSLSPEKSLSFLVQVPGIRFFLQFYRRTKKSFFLNYTFSPKKVKISSPIFSILEIIYKKVFPFLSKFSRYIRTF